MRTLETLTLREMQTLSARAITVYGASNNNLWKFNSQAHHNSQKWYIEVIAWYIAEYGGWPDEVGPGAEVQMVSYKCE